MSAPLGFQQEMSKEQTAQRLREAFGDGTLDDSLVKEYSTLRLFIPVTINEAEDMLETAARLMDLLTRRRSIAGEPFRYGLTCLTQLKRRALQATKADKAFPAKFLYLIDCVFHNWCDLLAEVALSQDPLRSARRQDLDRYVRREIDMGLNDFRRTGSSLSVQLPIILQPKGGKSTGGGLSSDSRKEPATEANADRKPRSDDQALLAKYKVNPEKEAAWCLPAGKSYNDFFKRGSPNLKKFPKMKHHTSGKKNAMCVYFQVGRCGRGAFCSLSHVPKSEMESGHADEVDKSFREIYST